MALHNTQKLDNDFGGGADQDLPLAPPFSIDDVILPLGGSLAIRDGSMPERTNEAVILHEYTLDLGKF